MESFKDSLSLIPDASMIINSDGRIVLATNPPSMIFALNLVREEVRETREVAPWRPFSELACMEREMDGVLEIRRGESV